MRYATVCSGVEGMSLAVRGMGWEPVFFSEIDPFPCAVLKHHYPDVPNLGDMRGIKGEDHYGTVDILAGGTPCQSFSIAGNRKGLDDERGSLMLHFARIAHEIKPKWLVWENVPGCLSSSKGTDFATLLSSLCGWDVEVPKNGWRNSGIVTSAPGCYGLAWRVLDAQYVRVDGYPRAVPQRRRRVWLVGNLGGWERAAQVFFIGEGVSRHPPPRRKAGQGTPADPRGDAGGAEPVTCMNFEMYDVGRDISPNLLKERCGDTFLCLPNGQSSTSLTKDYCGSLSCNHEAPIVGATANGKDVSPTISARQGEKLFLGNQEAFSGDYFVLDDQGGSQMEVRDNVTGTFTASRGKSHQPVIPDPATRPTPPPSDVLAIRMREGKEGGGKGPLISNGISLTLATRNDQTIALDPATRHADRLIAFAQNQRDEVRDLRGVAGAIPASPGMNQQTYLCYDPAHAKEIDVGMTVTGDHDAKISDMTHLIASNPSLYQPSQHQAPKESEVAMITAENCNHVRGDTPVICHAVEGNGSRPSHRGPGIGGDVGFTVNTVERHAVAYAFDSLASNSMKSPNPNSGTRKTDVSCALDTSDHNPSKNQGGIALAHNRALRRLTPLECERLMGFPDNYTRIAWRGKPAGDCPDAPRYKTCGNSWAVNCARWVMRRIEWLESLTGGTGE